MDMQTIWDTGSPVRDLGITVPEWIDQDISPSQIAAVAEGGCTSLAHICQQSLSTRPLKL